MNITGVSQKHCDMNVLLSDIIRDFVKSSAPQNVPKNSVRSNKSVKHLIKYRMV